MSYTSFLYLGVLLTLTYAVWAVVPAKRRPLVLLAASAVFFWMSSGKYILWLVAAALVTWLGGLALGRLAELCAAVRPAFSGEEKKEITKKIRALQFGVLAVSTTVLLAVYLWLKYSPFFVKSLNGVLAHLPNAPVLTLPAYVLPLGLSFYSLMAVGYLVDVFRGTTQPAQHFWQAALYLGFWPHVVEGPFDRFGALAPTLLGEEQKPDYRALCFGVQRILWGMFKKIVIADRANMFVNAVFNNYPAYSGMAVVLGTLLYTLQLYAEFSGCMDIALGSAEMFGIPLAENFRQPFFSGSVGEFWRRWHITLGAWLKEYLFQPLILSRPFVRLGRFCRAHFGPRAGRNVPVWLALVITWVAIGLWHGAGWKYLAYGLYYCFLQLLGEWAEPWLCKAFPRLPQWRKTRPYRAWQVVRTFALVNVGMFLFRANGLSVAFSMLRSVFVPYSGSLLIKLDARDLVVLAAGAVILLVADVLHARGGHLRETLAARPLPVRWAAYVLVVLVIMVFGAYGDSYDPAGFIYAQF